MTFPTVCIAMKFLVQGDDRCFHVWDILWFLVLSFTQVSSPITTQCRNYSLLSIMCLMHERDSPIWKVLRWCVMFFWHPSCTHFSAIQFAMAMLCSVPATMSVLSGKCTCVTEWMCMGLWVTAYCQYLSCLTDTTAFLHTSTIWWLTSTRVAPFTCTNCYYTVYFDINL